MHNKDIFLRYIVVLLFIAIIFFGYAMVTSIDQLRFQHEAVRQKLDEITEILSMMNFSNSSYALQENSLKEVKTLKIPFSKYFDENAEQGGRMIQTMASDTGNMNMLINNDATVSDFWSYAFDTLATRDLQNTNRFSPQMAETWSISEDHLVYHIVLRKGILWHDFTDPVTGKEWKNIEVKADDFKFFVDVIKDETVDAMPLRSYLSDIDRIDVKNDYEFDVVWKYPYFLADDITLSLQPLPKHFYHAYSGAFQGTKFNHDDSRNRMIVGCGPYQFVSWEKGKRVVFKRFEKYYGKTLGIMPPIKYIVFELIQHPSTRLQALKSQDVDISLLSSEQWTKQTDIPEFGENGFLRKIKTPSFSYSYIGLNQLKPIFQDKRTRKALSHLINRSRLTHDILHDLAQSISGPFDINSTAYDKSIEPDSFDIDLAKKMLADAGWGDANSDGVLDKEGISLQFTLIYPNAAEAYGKMLSIIKEDMAKAGVKMEIISLEWSVMQERIEKKNFDACIMGWRMGIGDSDPYQIWHSDNLKFDSSSNHISFSNSEADRLITEIRKCFDENQRMELYHQFHRLIHEEAPYLFLFTNYDLYAIHKRYQNVVVYPSGLFSRAFWVKRDAQMSVPGL